MTVAAPAVGALTPLRTTQPLLALTVPRFLVLLLAHSLLGAALPDGSFLGTIIAWGLVGGCVLLTIGRPEAGPYCAVYLVGFELLWRMVNANIWWEAGKYAAAVVLLLSVRNRFKLTPITASAMTYFLLLLPSCALTLGALSPSLARSRIAFNLSGPFLLATGIIALSLMPLNQVRPQRLLAFLILPIAGVAARVGWFTLQAENIVFEAEASFATSGGYGPNQVSTMLGVGALALVLLGTQSAKRSHQYLFYGLAGVLFFEGVLTFSRGGVGAFLLGILALFAHLTMTPRRARGFLVGLVLLSGVLWFVILPRADQWTGGQLAARFTSLESTGRGAIAEQDIQLFLDNPTLGVGVGLAPMRRPSSHFGAASHTEFTRALSEHGALGALSLTILLGLTIAAYLRAPTIGSKAWTAALVVWSVGNMATASMRLAASAAVLSLAFIDFNQLKAGSSRTSRSSHNR